jgi:hypothetical protein
MAYKMKPTYFKIEIELDTKARIYSRWKSAYYDEMAGRNVKSIGFWFGILCVRIVINDERI